MDKAREADRPRKAVVIVTGASSGLGAALTRRLDQTLPGDMDLWLIARDPGKLEALASDLDHDCQILALDLTREAAFWQIKDMLDMEEADIHLLVNNAGEGCSGPFEEQDLLAHQSLCDLNIRAQLVMTSLALPYMGPGSAILFTSSVAAFLPQPGFASYAASKAFILSFGRALGRELKDRAIQVTVTCPNPMLTNFFTKEEKEALMTSYKRLGIEDPARVADKSLAAIRRGKAVVVTSFAGRMIRILAKLLPAGLIIRLIKWS